MWTSVWERDMGIGVSAPMWAYRGRSRITTTWARHERPLSAIVTVQTQARGHAILTAHLCKRGHAIWATTHAPMDAHHMSTRLHDIGRPVTRLGGHDIGRSLARMGTQKWKPFTC